MRRSTFLCKRELLLQYKRIYHSERETESFVDRYPNYGYIVIYTKGITETKRGATVILTFVEVIAQSLSISIIAKTLLKIHSWKKFFINSALLITLYCICIFIYPTACSLISMLLLSVLAYHKNKNYFYSYYISSICIVFFIFANYVCVLGYRFIIPNQKLILAFPPFLYIQIFILSILVAISLTKVDLSLKSKINMTIQSLYNTVFLVFYLIITPKIYTYNDYFNTLIYSLMLVIFLSNIIMSFVIKNNEAKIWVTEANDKYLDYKKQTAIKQYQEAIIFKHNFAYRYHALSYYIQKKDMEGLSDYFNEYMMPIQAVHESNDRVLATLEKINVDIIRNSLFILYNQCCAYGISLRLNVSMELKKAFPDISQIDLMTIMGIFCEIALYQANKYRKSSISIFVENRESDIRLALENICQGKDVMGEIAEQFQDEIQINNEIVKKYKNVNIYISNLKKRFIQELFVAKGNAL